MALWLQFSSVWVWWTPPAGQHLLLWNSPGPVWSKDQANDLIFVILPACPGRNTYQPSEPPGLRQPGHLVIYTWPPGDPHLVSAGPSTTSKSQPALGKSPAETHASSLDTMLCLACARSSGQLEKICILGLESVQSNIYGEHVYTHFHNFSLL